MTSSCVSNIFRDPWCHRSRDMEGVLISGGVTVIVISINVSTGRLRPILLACLHELRNKEGKSDLDGNRLRTD
jgi:hypothetical protein